MRIEPRGRRVSTLAFCICWAGSAAWAAGADWGSLTGRFVLDRDPPHAAKIDPTAMRDCRGLDLVDESLVVAPIGRGVKNVLVYLHGEASAVHPDYAKLKGTEVLLEQIGCRFEPRVLPLTVDQTLVVKNRDVVPHNVRASLGTNPDFNRLLHGGQSFKHAFEKAERLPQRLVCDIHPWMHAYVLPCPHPYFAVSDADGRFEIKNLPAGFLEFRVWHEAVGWVSVEPAARPDGVRPTLKAAIPDGETVDLGVFKLDADRFARP